MDRSAIVLHLLAHHLEFADEIGTNLDEDDIRSAADPREVAALLPDRSDDHVAVRSAARCIHGEVDAAVQPSLAAHVLRIVVARVAVGRDAESLWRLAGALLHLPTMDEDEVRCRADEAIRSVHVDAREKIERVRQEHAEALRKIAPERFEAAKRSHMDGDG